MPIERLEIERATAYYDEERRLVRIAYRGKLDSDVTIDVYNWIAEVVKAVGLDTIRGEIFDFSEVIQFQDDNLATARKVSKRMNLRVDMSHLPVALVVKTFYQEEILRGSMQISPLHQRKRIVKSEQEALDFIDDWYKTRQPASPAAEPPPVPVTAPEDKKPGDG